MQVVILFTIKSSFKASQLLLQGEPRNVIYSEMKKLYGLYKVPISRGWFQYFSGSFSREREGKEKRKTDKKKKGQGKERNMGVYCSVFFDTSPPPHIFNFDFLLQNRARDFFL